MERKVRTGRLKIGMYVSNLDRPWLDTPFLVQGFFIQDKDEIRALDQYCEYVYIDVDRGVTADIYWDENFTLPSNKYMEAFLRSRIREVDYSNEHSVADEIPQAHLAFEAAFEKFGGIMSAIKQGVKLDLKKVKSLIEPLIDSVLRNPDAMLWLSQLRKPEEFLFSPSVHHCVLAIAFGRYAGLPKEDIFRLAIGTLLFDIGKLNVQEEVLLKGTVLSEIEFSKVRQHVDEGYDYLILFDGLHEDSLNTVLTHHERYDGSGYPNKLSGRQIPVFGRIAGMIDCYQAMISRRPYSDAISAHGALQKLFNWRNKYFQSELVDQFLKCMGAHPTGSLLEMKSGEVGIVLSQNRDRHMRPKVMLLLDKNKNDLVDYPVIDLMARADEGSYEILRGLDPGAYGIVYSDLYMLAPLNEKMK
ncbi:MAG: DUF3391 domain-containing protein [Gammaproteobacteria bacterium]|nr:DUF3391 domain-containing protein [Gammaproteobacteria bacterium]